MKGRAIGAVVRLYDWEPGFGIGIAEGIETALATEWRPLFAGLTAGGIERFPVLPHVPALTIFADNDASGTVMKAAKICADRWHDAGREVIVVVPKDVGADFAMQEAA